MPPTIVAYPKLTETFKSAMYEVLSALFDGQTHEVGGVDIDFPTAKIVFDSHYLSAGADGLTIGIIGAGVANQQEYHDVNPLDNTKPGVRVYADITRSVIIGTNFNGAARNQKKLEVDRAWDCLYAAFMSNWKEFSDRNILRPQLPVHPVDVVERIDYVQASGMLHAQIQASYSKFNLP